MRAFCFEVSTAADIPKFVREISSYMLRMRYHFVEDAKDFVKIASAIRTKTKRSQLCQSYNVEVQVQTINNIGEIILRRAPSGKEYVRARFYLEKMSIGVRETGTNKFGQPIYDIVYDDTQRGGETWPKE